ncbi:hypothetical protein AB4212_65145, partial [Streptomyces sp. 2MCAF27]
MNHSSGQAPAHAQPHPQQPQPQPSVGSIAAHRPHAVAAQPVRNLDPDLDGDLDSYEVDTLDAEGEALPQG